MTDDRRLDLKTAQRPAAGHGLGVDQGLMAAPVINATVVRYRRRLVRLTGLLTFLGGIGLSVIPGPKGSADTISHVTDNGVATTVHKFSYYRPYGVPFMVARVQFGEGTEVKSVDMTGEGTVGFLGNLAVAFMLVVGATMALKRRRET